MQQHPSKISQRQSGASTGETENLLRQAVEHGLCVRVTYRCEMMLIAPHILYTRGAAAYLDGVALHRDQGTPNEGGIETFKLTALKSIVMTSEPFAIHRDFDRTRERYRDHFLVASEP